jgi:hypothetical protein
MTKIRQIEKNMSSNARHTEAHLFWMGERLEKNSNFVTFLSL